MHCIKIFNHKLMGNVIEGLTEVHKGHHDSMGVLQVQVLVDELQEPQEVVGDGGSLQTKLTRVQVWANNR